MKTKTPRISLTTRLALLMILSISFPSALEAQSGNQEKKPDEAQAYTETAGGAAIEMVLVPAGKYLMGSPLNEAGRDGDEGPQHEVSVSSFYIGKYEVTQAQWRAVVALPRVKIDLNPDPSYFKGDTLPVEQVRWEEAVEFCDRLSTATGKPYRLPTESEWEYACRARTTGPFAGGLDGMGWYGDNSGRSRLDSDKIWKTDRSNYVKRMLENGCRTRSVGQKKPNGFGLYDMHGNVWEWCMDWFSKDYYSQRASDNPTGPVSGTDRVFRGGGWGDSERNCRSALRSGDTLTYRSPDLGFRIVRTLR
jgi:formylglycine-generating enzyme required for sulfatase activity